MMVSDKIFLSVSFFFFLSFQSGLKNDLQIFSSFGNFQFIIIIFLNDNF